jgi:fumarate reductase subunit C
VAVRSHPDTMKPRHGSYGSRTPTAPPWMPDGWWALHPRYRRYMLFGATGVVFAVMGLLVLRAVWALGTGPEAWRKQLESLRSPPYVVWHAFALPVVLWFGHRLFQLFPHTQPPRIGPLRRPPLRMISLALYGAWIVATVAMAAVLIGAVP